MEHIRKVPKYFIDFYIYCAWWLKGTGDYPMVLKIPLNN